MGLAVTKMVESCVEICWNKVTSNPYLNKGTTSSQLYDYQRELVDLYGI
jgi:hypothetical protein